MMWSLAIELSFPNHPHLSHSLHDFLGFKLPLPTRSFLSRSPCMEVPLNGTRWTNIARESIASLPVLGAWMICWMVAKCRCLGWSFCFHGLTCGFWLLLTWCIYVDVEKQTQNPFQVPENSWISGESSAEVGRLSGECVHKCHENMINDPRAFIILISYNI